MRCLAVVGRETELDPGQGAVLGRPGALGNLGEHGVVGDGVSAEVLLDADELRRTFTGGGEHERLQAAGHPAVAVTERVDEREVQMRHGCSHRRRPLAATDLRQRLVHQRLHEFTIGCLVHDFAAGAGYPHGARPPAAGMLAEVVLHHHEVQRQQERDVDVGSAGGHLQDAGHGPAVAGDGAARLIAHLGGFLTVDDCGGALNARVVALDGQRPARCAGKFRSPQRARPAARFVQEEPQVLSQSPDHG